MKKTMIMLCLALVSWGANAQHDHAAHGAQTSSQTMEPMFKDKALGSSYTHYIHLKNALVASDFQQAKSASESLTSKELDVVQGLVDGMSYKMIAAQLEVSLNTVNFHIRNIYSV